tara:strand:+ start:5039 stop:6520 length:1482 start_codon:yes stop_codon:yes gene_type:complete
MVRFGVNDGDNDQARLIPGESPDRVEKFDFKAARQGRKKPATIWCCDCISAWISVLVLVVGFGISVSGRTVKLWDLKFELWDQNILVSNDTAFNHSFNNWTHGVQDFCPKNEKRHVHEIKAYWNASNYQGTAIIEGATMDSAFGYAFAWFMPWIVLFIIFIVSICFQCGRLYVDDTCKIENNEPTWWAAGSVEPTYKYLARYMASWAFPFYFILGVLFTFGTLFGGIVKVFGAMFQSLQAKFQSGWENRYADGKLKMIFRRPYQPDKPEFWRWVEYALTSPLQILLIAYSVFIGERATLFNLMGLQGAMVMMGWINEKHINKIWKLAINYTYNYEGDGPDWGYVWYKLILLMTFSWLFFAAIWWTILSRFARQVDNQTDCNFIDKMPDAVNFILWTQSLLFAAFGIVQTLQVDHLRLYMKEQFPMSNMFFSNKNRILEARSATDNKQASDIESIRANTWYTVTLWYSILSVTAKSILEIGFIFLVWAQGETRT